MYFINELLKTTIFILFPLSLFLIYLAYKNNLNVKEQNVIFSICLISSLYLVLKLNKEFNIYYMLLINIPLLISFIKRKKDLSILLLVIIIFYYYFCLGLNIYLVTAEYLLYYYIYYYIVKEKMTSDYFINTFTLIKGFILSIEIYFFNSYGYSDMKLFQIFVLLVVFYFISLGIIKLLQQGEKIIDLNKLLTELEKEKAIRSALFKVTHEVKNPISVCKGYLDMMDYEKIENVKKYNGIIKKEIDRTLSIMDNFLDYTKIKINTEIMDICMLIEDVISSMNIMFDYKNIKVESILPDDEVFVMGDYNRLKQVLVNIIKNSIEAIEKDGLINIKCSSSLKTVTITIIDNGIGMSKETLEHISDIFYTTKPNGTGLGVNLSMEIVKLHKGTISYKSELGKGTEVMIKLPRKKLRYS